MSIATEIERLVAAKNEITSALEKKGIDVDFLAKIDGYGEKVLGFTQKVNSYHYLEAFEVAKKINNIKSLHPNHRYVTFGCIADSHVDIYCDEENRDEEKHSKASIKSGAFALQTVGNLVNADFLVNLGDNSALSDFSEAECLISQEYLKDVCVSTRNSREMFHLVGNHDRSSETVDVYNMIGVLNDFDTPTSASASLYTPQRSYGYKDFPDCKLRVICLNTTDYWCVIGGNGMSYEQKKLFSEFLDLSDKTDASQWQILILSHIPLDFKGGSDNKYADLKTILDAYQAGTSAIIEVGSDYSKTDNVTSSFTIDYSGGRNAAKIICNIHGHLHMIRDQVNPDNDIVQICTPNTCGIAHYSSKDNDTKAEKYNYEGDPCEKEQGTAKDTACTWYVIDLDANIVYSYIYGARNDIERTIPYNTSRRFKIINNLTNCSTPNTRTSIYEGLFFSETVTAKDGYELKNVTVTMGGEDITDNVYSDGNITIESVTGDVVVTVEATAKASYTNLFSTEDENYSVGRLNSSGAVNTSYTSGFVSGFIEATFGDVIRAKGSTSFRSTYGCIAFYDSSKKHFNQLYIHSDGVVVSNDDTEFEIDTSKLHSQYEATAFIRVMGYGSPDGFIITKNQEIV